MKIIHSFWSKPITMRDNSEAIFRDKGGWSNKAYYYMSWALSCLKFKELYGNVELVTDKYGKELLYDILQLPYTSIKVELDCLNDYSHHLWALGKIYAYSIQEEPFLHVDSDVFIWKKFPANFIQKKLIAQNYERNYDENIKFYNHLKTKFRYIPESMEAESFSNIGDIMQINAGILGGSDIDFFKFFTKQAFLFIEKNHDLLDDLKQSKGLFNMVYEQCLFYCLAKQKNLKIDVLLDNVEKNSVGLANFHLLPDKQYYIHALGTYKKYSKTCNYVAERLFVEYPEYYNRIIKLLKCNYI